MSQVGGAYCKAVKEIFALRSKKIPGPRTERKRQEAFD